MWKTDNKYKTPFWRSVKRRVGLYVASDTDFLVPVSLSPLPFPLFFGSVKVLKVSVLCQSEMSDPKYAYPYPAQGMHALFPPNLPSFTKFTKFLHAEFICLSTYILSPSLIFWGIKSLILLYLLNYWLEIWWVKYFTFVLFLGWFFSGLNLHEVGKLWDFYFRALE